MKLYNHAPEVAEQIIEKFKSGEVPKALSTMFLRSTTGKPMESWSWGNQFYAAMMGMTDARGYKQWQQVGRQVSKGAKALFILGPLKKTYTKEDDEGNEKQVSFLYGFRSVSVYDINSTVIVDEDLWEKSKLPTVEVREVMDELPFKEVARRWDLDINFYKGAEGKALGYFKPGEIAIGTRNLSTWAHELIHAADYKNDYLTPGQKGSEDKIEAEIVAEFGGAALLYMAGHEHSADLGGAWDYITRQTGGETGKALQLCLKLNKRVCENIQLVLREAGYAEDSRD